MSKLYQQHKASNERYLAKMAMYQIRMKPETKEQLQAHASARGESVNGFILRAIAETIARDNDNSNNVE